ncbi:MAG: hypothetical protein FRX48_06345 [Lasallia pustulata]|uniref:Uncharacterized protein n=1 Tax=Lasallia pustulata TaxID=136370 RepID=A0A5M8PJW5_9LECA|nr:MAG: hypothetical protein FRX48_06345 [Lasallia pustulata]
MLTASAAIPGNSVQLLLTQVFAEVIHWMNIKGANGFLTNGEFVMDGPNAVTIRIWNTNNHQLTIATLGAAVMALENYMRENNWFGAATFYIWDGPNEIGAGLIGVTR